MAVIDLKDAGVWVENMGTAWREAALRGLLSAGARGAVVIQTQIIPARSPQPVDRGIYRAGWKYEPTKDGADIYNNEPEAPFIEFGVRGANVKIGRKMIDALAQWSVRKGLAEDLVEGTRVAWAIARAAKRRGIFNRNGTEGLGILKELVERHLPRLIREEVTRELRLVRLL